MLEVALGLGTLSLWFLGLCLYPRCMDDTADLCEQTFIRRRNSLVIEETEAHYREAPESSQIEKSFVLVSAKYVSSEESPLFRRQPQFPLAKVIGNGV